MHVLRAYGDVLAPRRGLGCGRDGHRGWEEPQPPSRGGRGDLEEAGQEVARGRRPEMHLPVRGVDEGTCRHWAQASSSAATPGSSLPSRNSSDAPPPVDTCVMRSSSPAWATAAAESPPPTTVTAPFAVAAAMA